jgi:trk system potassium uptake protein TrkH
MTVFATVRGETVPQVFGRRIATALVYRAMAVTSLFVAAHFALTLALSITEESIANKEFGLLPLMFETMSGLATVGLSTGITPEISGPGKIILCLAMFLGRLGPLTVAYALQRRQRQPRYRYAQASVRIG